MSEKTDGAIVVVPGWHRHRWTAWSDVQIRDEVEPTSCSIIALVRQVIRQQRRCIHCNMVQTRCS